MGRYTGPKCRHCRREGEKLFLKGARCFTSKCAIDRKRSIPGVHGAFKARRRLSEYGLRLRAKQKAKRIYKLFEKQFSNYFKKAKKMKGALGNNLLRSLETRFDSFIYNCGFALSRDQARQLIGHKHFLINGKVVSIPSYQMNEGDIVTYSPRGQKSSVLKEVKPLLKKKKDFPDWIHIDKEKLEGKVLRLPVRKDIVTNINTQYIIEYYSR